LNRAKKIDRRFNEHLYRTMPDCTLQTLYLVGDDPQSLYAGQLRRIVAVAWRGCIPSALSVL
jgi:hypothetical protein